MDLFCPRPFFLPDKVILEKATANICSAHNLTATSMHFILYGIVFSKLLLHCFLANAVGGLLYGYSIGYVPAMFFFHTQATHCPSFNNTTMELCETANLAPNGCTWNNTTGGCQFSDFQAHPCGQFATKEACHTHASNCAWLDRNDDGGVSARFQCVRTPVWGNIKAGLFAVASLVGGIIGALSTLVKGVPTKHSFYISSAACLLGTLFLELAGGTGWAWLVAGRVLIGVAFGMLAVRAPLYVGEMAPQISGKKTAGVVFQLSITAGKVLVALLAWAADPLRYAHRDVKASFHVINLGHAALGLLLLYAGKVIPPSMMERANRGEGVGDGVDLRHAQRASASMPVFLSDLKQPFISAIALASVLQLSGIDAVFNFTPRFTHQVNIYPTTGLLILFLWNFVSTLPTLLLVNKYSPRGVYIGGAIVASCSSILAGVFLMPSVTGDHNFRFTVSIVFVAIFVSGFSIGSGPFYYLSQSIFPSGQNWRSKGCAFIMILQFTIDIVVVATYPTAVLNLSKHGQDDPSMGVGAMLCIFGSLGMLGALTLWKTLDPRVVEEEGFYFKPQSLLDDGSQRVRPAGYSEKELN